MLPDGCLGKTALPFSPNARTQAQKRLLYGRAVTPLATADAAHYVREIPPRPPNVIERLSWEDSPTIINSPWMPRLLRNSVPLCCATPYLGFLAGLWGRARESEFS